MTKIIFIGFLLMLLNGCKGNENTDEEKMFSTPENTLKIYYLALGKGDKDLLNSCFKAAQYFSGRVYTVGEIIFKVKSKKEVTEVNVIEFEEWIKKNDEDFRKRHPDTTYSMYQEFLRDRDTYKQAGDVEIIITVKAKDGSYEETAFLRNINDEWKLIDEPRVIVR